MRLDLLFTFGLEPNAHTNVTARPSYSVHESDCNRRPVSLVQLSVDSGVQISTLPHGRLVQINEAARSKIEHWDESTIPSGYGGS